MVDGVADIPLTGKTLRAKNPAGPSAALGNFVAGPENGLVETAVRAASEPRATPYNPLVLFGPVGTGKSHVVHGLAKAWKARDRRCRVVVMPAVDFARDWADAIASQGVEEFRAKHRDAALWIIEDIDQLTEGKLEKTAAQEELIHTLDARVAEERWSLVTASAAPAALTGLMPGLQSRLSAGLTVPLVPPSRDSRLAILEQLAEARGIALPEVVARVLAEGIAGSAPTLAGALLELAMPAELENQTLDEAAARRYVAERGRAKQPTLHEIALATARHFSLRLNDLRSPVRQRALVVGRGVAVYLARRLTDESLDNIGAYFGGRDHTTVMHSCRKTEELIVADASVREAVDHIQQQLWKT